MKKKRLLEKEKAELMLKEISLKSEENSNLTDIETNTGTNNVDAKCEEKDKQTEDKIDEEEKEKGSRTKILKDDDSLEDLIDRKDAKDGAKVDENSDMKNEEEIEKENVREKEKKNEVEKEGSKRRYSYSDHATQCMLLLMRMSAGRVVVIVKDERTASQLKDFLVHGQVCRTYATLIQYTTSRIFIPFTLFCLVLLILLWG